MVLAYLTGKRCKNTRKSSYFLIDFKNVIWYNSKLRRCACRREKGYDTPERSMIKEGEAA